MRPDIDAVTRELRSSTPGRLDLTLGEHIELVHAAADRLIGSEYEHRFLDELESDLLADDEERAALGAHLAVKLARSKQRIRALDEAHHVSVVFAVYKENLRILPRSENEVGEDFLRRKLRQMEWLGESCPNFDWDLTVVDDGCPEGSGAIAEAILADDRLGERGQVLYLRDAIERQHPVTASLRSVADSQKGASIEYGMARAVEIERPGHIVVYTDADLSTNLGQVGLLVDGLERLTMDAAIGSRRQPTSVAVKRGRRNVRGKLFIYLWKHLLTPLSFITDTQCGFKAFRADVVRDILHGVIEKKFAFDIELLLKTELHRTGSIARVPIAWIDSEAASTTTDIGPYLSMLHGIVSMYRRYLPPSEKADRFAAFVESLDEIAWQKLIDVVPAAITDGDPRTFGQCDDVTVADLEALL